jgi:uncharacterized Fe-S cluster-containing MiaB family protein
MCRTINDPCPVCEWMLTAGECELCGYVLPEVAHRERIEAAGRRLAHDVPGMTPEEGAVIIAACLG